MKKLGMVMVGTLFMVVDVSAHDNLKKTEGTGTHSFDEVYVNKPRRVFCEGVFTRCVALPRVTSSRLNLKLSYILS